MNLRHLEFFVQLAKTEHMAQAAELLGISQPSLSYAINSLEKELGVPLFEKDGRNIRLTNYGKIYLHYVEKSLNELNAGSEYISELLDINKGHINLGFTFTMGQDLVPRLVHEFKKEPSTRKISFSFKQGTTSDLINNLLNDQLDLVFASRLSNMNEQKDISSYHLVDQELLAAVPPKHPLAKKNEVTLQELAQYPFILYSKNSGLRPKLDLLFAHNQIQPKIEMEAMEDHTIIGFVHWGYGVAIVPHLPQLDKDQVKLLHIKDDTAVHPLFCYTKVNHFLTPSVSRFQDFAEYYCKTHYLKPNILL